MILVLLRALQWDLNLLPHSLLDMDSLQGKAHGRTARRQSSRRIVWLVALGVAAEGLAREGTLCAIHLWKMR